MTWRPIGILALAAFGLASCGRSDASGVYLYRAGGELTVIQLVQAKTGSVSGRLETLKIGPNGAISDQSSTLDGVASSFSGDTLTIAQGGRELKARRATLAEYQKAVAALQAEAAGERQRVAGAQARQADAQAQAEAIETATDKGARLEAVAAQLRDAADKLDAAVASAPDFGGQAAANTARIIQMAGQAPALSGQARAQLAASADQLVVATNQIDFGRTQYAVGLNQIIRSASPLVTDVREFCGSPQGARLGPSCGRAGAAADAFDRSLVHGSVVFKGYKQTIQTELQRQTALAQRIGR